MKSASGQRHPGEKQSPALRPQFFCLKNIDFFFAIFWQSLLNFAEIQILPDVAQMLPNFCSEVRSAENEGENGILKVDFFRN